MSKVEAAVGGDPTLSIRDLAIKTGMSRAAARNVLKHSLKKKSLTQVRIQHIRKKNVQRRLDICKEWKAQMENGWALGPRDVFWADEKVIHAGRVAGGNRNYRAWVDEGVRKCDVPHEDIVRAENDQGGARVMVALGVCYAGPGEPRFVPTGAKVNAAAYLELVENTYAVDVQELMPAGNVLFQQDNAPARQATVAQGRLPEFFPRFWNKREWPATSPDLNVLDYYVWGHLQHIVEKMKPTDLVSLKAAVRRAARELPLEGIRSAIDGFYRGVCLCVEAEGRAFKHMMSRTVEPPPRSVASATGDGDAAMVDVAQYDQAEPTGDAAIQEEAMASESEDDESGNVE